MLKGSCYCGSVRFEIDDEPIQMYCCHCNTCRKVTGASFSTTALFEAAGFRIVDGEESVVAVAQASHQRHHCGSCHCWLFDRSDAFAGVVFVPCGTLDTAPSRGIDFHAYYSQKADWVEISDGTPIYDEALPESELEHWQR